MLSDFSIDINTEPELTDEELEALRKSKTLDDYIEEVEDNASGY